jgi:hypothetical protein
MRLHWTWARLALGVTCVALVAGCSGINASHSVSPASFFLPGLLQVEPPSPDPAAAGPERPPQFAQVQ